MTFRELMALSKAADEMGAEMSGPQCYGPYAMVNAGSATWDMWQNHVPQIVVELWPELSTETRIAIYVTAKAFTNYKEIA